MAETIIGSGIVVEGDISGSDPVTILGTVRGGRVQVKDVLTVAQSGRVEGDVDANGLELSGSIQGNVTCSDKIDIKAGGRLVGDVKAPRVLIADGASFKGNINMGS